MGDREASGVDRRRFLQGAGAVTSLAFFGAMAHRLGLAAATPQPRDGTDQMPTVQPDPGTVESGLAAFAATWNGAGPVLAATRFGRFVVNKTFNCHVANTPRAFSLALGPTGAALSPGRDPTAHADVVLDEQDWLDVLGGEFTGLAPVLAGRAYPRKDEANKITTLLLVMYVAAHLPVELDGDPRFTEELVEGFLQRGGLPECEGEPPSFDTLARIQRDPQGQLSEPILAPDDVPPVTDQLATWVHDLRFEDVPAEQVRVAKAQLKNTLGPIYAGTTMAPAQTYLDEVQAWDEPGQATVVGTDGARTSPRAAAMANGFLAQALEWEDWTRLAHSGSAVVPVALAAAEHAGASGEELITAIVAGNEILARFGGVMTDILHSGQTLPIHQIELPLVAGKLLGLSKTQLKHAAGVAGTQPQLTSLPAWTSGAKGLITAEPAGASMRAAQLASAGLSGRHDQIENPLGYLYRLSDVRHPRDVQRAMEDLGEAWWFEEVTYFNKRYPVDGFTLTAVHAMLEARRSLIQDGIDPRDPSQVESIRIHQNLPLASTATMYNEGEASVLDRVLDPDRPDWTYTSLLYDGRYPLLAALVHGDLTQAHYRPDVVASPEIRALWEKVYEGPNLSMGVFGAEVQISPAGGSSLRAQVGLPEGQGSMVGCIREDVNEGFTADDKFHKTARPVVTSKHRRERILDAIDTLEHLDDVASFTALL